MIDFNPNDIDLGDILRQYDPVQQQRVHYLVVDVFRLRGKFYYATLQPLDSDNKDDYILFLGDLQNEFCTWRRVA
jgi:hypothetical protein